MANSARYNNIGMSDSLKAPDFEDFTNVIDNFFTEAFRIKTRYDYDDLKKQLEMYKKGGYDATLEGYFYNKLADRKFELEQFKLEQSKKDSKYIEKEIELLSKTLDAIALKFHRLKVKNYLETFFQKMKEISNEYDDLRDLYDAVKDDATEFDKFLKSFIEDLKFIEDSKFEKNQQQKENSAVDAAALNVVNTEIKLLDNAIEKIEGVLADKNFAVLQNASSFLKSDSDAGSLQSDSGGGNSKSTLSEGALNSNKFLSRNSDFNALRDPPLLSVDTNAASGEIFGRLAGQSSEVPKTEHPSSIKSKITSLLK